MSRRDLNTITIDDPADPRVAPYMNLKDAHLAVQAGREPEDRARGLFIAEGVLVVSMAIDSAYRVQSLLLTPRRLETMESLSRLEPGVPVYVAGREVIESIVGFDLHRGVLAACERGQGLDADTLIERSRALVILEELSNHDNVGGIFRSCAALGGDQVGVLLSPRCCDPLYRKAIRVSMGHVLRVGFATLDAWPGGLERVMEAGFDLLALTTAPDAVDIGQVTSSRPAILVGAEGEGLSERAASMGQAVTIPMQAGADSLNAGVATAIALHRLVAPR